MFYSFKYTYQLKRAIKIGLLFFALLIAGISMFYTYNLALKLKQEEIKKMEVWAAAMTIIADPNSSDEHLSFYAKIISDNTTIPVILLDHRGKITARNIDSLVLCDSVLMSKRLGVLMASHKPIVIDLGEGDKQYVYYDDSILLQKLKYYPLFQLLVISVFLLIAYMAFSYARRSEQNKVWVGLAKETAHQLGTPMSSLLAWLDLMEDDPLQANQMAFTEMRKDMTRLRIITERFSKIGSEPILEPVFINDVLINVVNYMRLRVPSSIHISLDIGNVPLSCDLNTPLFEWVFENLIKNAIDAIKDGTGNITIRMFANRNGQCIIDVTDTGAGISSSKFKTVFKPGYTTKKRGWGLGLSLVKRIVTEYHRGLIFVKESVLKKGTTFRIQLPLTKDRKL